MHRSVVERQRALRKPLLFLVPPLDPLLLRKTIKHSARLNLPDGVVRPQANPLGNGTVLLLSFGKLLLGAEGLLALFPSKKSQSAKYPVPAEINKRRKYTHRHLDGCAGDQESLGCLSKIVVVAEPLSTSAGPRQSANVTRIILCGRLSLTTLVLAG